MTTGSERGPFLSAALLCEKVLVEQDGVKSAIRIIDRITRTVVGPNPPPEMQPWDYDIILLIKLKSGWARGVHPVKIEMSKPSGERTIVHEQNVLFEGEEDRGVDLTAHIHMNFQQTGIYWIHIKLGDQQLTQLPFRVVYMPQVIRPIPGQGQGHPPQA